MDLHGFSLLFGGNIPPNEYLNKKVSLKGKQLILNGKGLYYKNNKEKSPKYKILLNGNTVSIKNKILDLYPKKSKGERKIILWDSQTSPPDIYVYDSAAPQTKEGANDLSDYIEKSSGIKPPVIEQPETFSFPLRCIKVGYPNKLQKREEIQIKCDENGTIDLTGVDEFDPLNPHLEGSPTEYNFMSQAGSYNAVMTFLHEYIGVVWGWIGPYGEAVPSHSKLLMPIIDKKHTPSALVRNPFNFSKAGSTSIYGVAPQWLKRQRGFGTRTQFAGSHGFRDFYAMYHPNSGPDGTNDPKFIEPLGYLFALQPGGERSGHPQGHTSKVEFGEPDLVDYWYNYKVNSSSPLTKGYAAGFNDGHSSGHSVDIRSLEMGYPPAGRVETGWNSTTQIKSKVVKFVPGAEVGEEVKIIFHGNNGGNQDQIRTIISNTEDTLTVDAGTPFPENIDDTQHFKILKDDDPGYGGLSDICVAFGNKCAKKVFEAGREDVNVSIIAYGPSRIAPKKVFERGLLNNRLYISNVANDLSHPHSDSGWGGNTHNENFEEWLKVYPKNQVWRPNTGSAYGHRRGMYYTHVKIAMKRLQDRINKGVVGLTPDSLWEHWSNQWPMYYVALQLLWDNNQDIDEILDKAYNTLFGPAAPHIKAYYEKTEEVISNNLQSHTGIIGTANLWNESVTDELQIHLNNAANAPNLSQEQIDRVAWVQMGLTWAKDVVVCCNYWIQYNTMGIIQSGTNIANGQNAIESDIQDVTGWFNDKAGTNPALQDVVASDNPNGGYFAFKLDSLNRGHRSIVRSEPIPAVDPAADFDFYIAAVDVKHSGIGGPWIFTRTTAGDPNTVAITSDQTEWRTIYVRVYEGDNIKFRRNYDAGGIIFVDNLQILQAASPNNSQIETEWNAYREQAVNAVRQSDFWAQGSRPIGEAAAAINRPRLPMPSSTDGNLPPGYE